MNDLGLKFLNKQNNEIQLNLPALKQLPVTKFELTFFLT